MSVRIPTIVCFLFFVLCYSVVVECCTADEFTSFVKPLLTKRCVTCHGQDKVSGEVNFKEVATREQLLAKPQLIADMIDAVDGRNMPPRDEPQLNDGQRTKLVSTLKTLLRASASANDSKSQPIRRLNRFQYNNAVKDLFQLRHEVFELPEKLMTRHTDYLKARRATMPPRVDVSCQSLNPAAGLRDVTAFPKDLRAAHGFDNQSNQLTLSPLLLDAFLKLSVSIVESPDFNQETVGIWNEFFAEPGAETDKRTEVERRLSTFLPRAFRGPVDDATLTRYIDYTMSKIDTGLPFTASMKKVASAAMSSPMFLYRYQAEDRKHGLFELASDLSFFLWSSGPDNELLRLAANDELSRPEVLDRTIDRMLADPKIERFLDTFPAQWMQLENVLAATPDPRKARLFKLDRERPASTQMVLEPLLLFDAVFVEDRPVIELIAPKFSYQSEFLKTWYTSDLQPPKIDVRQIVAKNRTNDDRRKELQATIDRANGDLDALLTPVKEKLLAARKADNDPPTPVDLKPYAAWDFDGNLEPSVNSFHLQSHGKIEFVEGMVVLNRAYLLSDKLPIDLKAKSLEVWCKVHDLNQNGGGLMGIQGPGDFFDTIVLGERKAHHWISGSNGFSRTEDFPNSTPETKVNELLHLVMVYAEDGTTRLYRDGQPYGKSFRKGSATFPKNQTSVIFGLRHLPRGGNKFLQVTIDKARLYDRALTADEVASSASGNNLFVTEQELLAALTAKQKAKHESLQTTIEQSHVAIKAVPPNQDPAKAQQESQRRFDDEIRRKLHARAFERRPASDPRYGGVITNAAMLSMTSGPKRTHPIARGAWIIEVIFNDPPPPPPNDVPPLNEEASAKNLTIREKFAQHRKNADCAGCHARLDPLGFAMENFDITGRWRDRYENGRDVDASGKLLKTYDFDGVVRFKESLAKEETRFVRAFTAHLLRFALASELRPADSLIVDDIVAQTAADNFKLESLIKQVILSNAFRHGRDQ